MSTISPFACCANAAREQKRYPFCLSEANKSVGVFAHEDICTTEGLLLVPNGHPITDSLAKTIATHELKKPLVDSVYVANPIDLNTLKTHFRELFSSFPDVKIVNERHDFQETLEELIDFCPLEPILLGELTVFRECFPSIFRKTIFCTWISSLVAFVLEYDKETLQDVFLSGLSHDIGFLHIPKQLFMQSSPLTPQEWLAIQSHVVLGNDLLGKIYGSESVVANAALEHHERLDGSGYPLGKKNEHINKVSQIIGIADMIQAVRGRFEPHGRTLKDLSSFLKINSGRISDEIRYAVTSILDRSEILRVDAGERNNLKQTIDSLVHYESCLKRSIEHIADIENSVALSISVGGEKISKLIAPVNEMVCISGLASGKNLDWLFSLQKTPSIVSPEEICETEMTQNELSWQIDSVCKAVRHEVFVSKNIDSHMEHAFYLSSKISWLLNNK